MLKKASTLGVETEKAISKHDVSLNESSASKQDKEKVSEIILTYERTLGFSKSKWSTIKNSFTKNGYKLIRKYTKRIENELDFRFITSKKIEIIILVVLSITSILLFVLQSKESGILFVFALIFFIYLLSIIKA